MGLMDKIKKEYKLQTVGNSTGIIIHVKDLKALGVKLGDEVIVTIEVKK